VEKHPLFKRRREPLGVSHETVAIWAMMVKIIIARRGRTLALYYRAKHDPDAITSRGYLKNAVGAAFCDCGLTTNLHTDPRTRLRHPSNGISRTLLSPQPDDRNLIFAILTRRHVQNICQLGGYIKRREVSVRVSFMNPLARLCKKR
jgi:hypothetical protein